MKTPIIWLPAFLALASCEKVKEMSEQATLAAREQVAETIGKGAGTTSDPQLKKLVNQTADGVVFRKDLPFPVHLKVRSSRSQLWNGRVVQQSAIERKSEALVGTRISVHQFESAGNIIRQTIEEAGFAVPSDDKKDESATLSSDPLVSLGLSSKSTSFIKKNGSWQSETSGNLHNVTLAEDLKPYFDSLLAENALAPRPLWFSEKKRFKPGDEITISGASLPMLVSGNASGSLTLKLESFEAVDGHPCAVFSIVGNYTRKQYPDFDGVFSDVVVTIQSGQIWLSLLHPMILREEFDTIQNVQIGRSGQQNASAQGTVKHTLKRTWRPIENSLQ